MSYRAPLDDIGFALKYGAALGPAIEQGLFGDLSLDDVEAVLAEAGRFAGEVIAPLNRIGDTFGAKFADGAVTTAPGWKEAYRDWRLAGWNAVTAPAEWGGQALPQIVNAACTEMWHAASVGFANGPMLTMAAIDALNAHGSDTLKRTYLEKLVSGEWMGTMQLTEPQAGSDVGALRTRAERAGDGSYRLKGQKIFITYGEHDFTDNIIHFVLARLPDAPAGTRGISLFLVPKFLLRADGSLGARNDIRAHSIEHKLGIHGSPTCTMILGDNAGAIGFLIGEENAGMACMFTMMNRARLAVGLQGVGIAERATQQALAYARERKQGRAAGMKATESAPIIDHPDVRRMLLTMRALTQAARGICYAAAMAIDRSERSTDDAARQAAHTAGFAPHARGQGVLDRHRQRGRFAWRAGAWRHGLYRGNRRGAVFPRCADRADLRRHQRHPGDRSGHPQTAAGERRRRRGALRGLARHRRCVERQQRSGLRLDGGAAWRCGRKPVADDELAAGQNREGARRGARRRQPLSAAVRHRHRRLPAGEGGFGGAPPRRRRRGAPRDHAVFCRKLSRSGPARLNAPWSRAATACSAPPMRRWPRSGRQMMGFATARPVLHSLQCPLSSSAIPPVCCI